MIPVEVDIKLIKDIFGDIFNMKIKQNLKSKGGEEDHVNHND